MQCCHLRFMCEDADAKCWDFIIWKINTQSHVCQKCNMCLVILVFLPCRPPDGPRLPAEAVWTSGSTQSKHVWGKGPWAADLDSKTLLWWVRRGILVSLTPFRHALKSIPDVGTFLWQPPCKMSEWVHVKIQQEYVCKIHSERVAV